MTPNRKTDLARGDHELDILQQLIARPHDRIAQTEHAARVSFQTAVRSKSR